MPKRNPQPSGGARLSASGKKPMLIGWSEADHELIRQAAARQRCPMTSFVMLAAVEKAAKVLAK